LAYNAGMTTSTVLEQLLEPVGRSLNGEAARALIEIKIDPKVQKRIDRLAEKCNEGKLTSEERDEYESYVSAGSLIAILQAKARLRISQSAAN
jgi:hypothetical protein